MAFTAQDVKELREKTGCGMMDCKKALTEANGDMDAAIDFLREKGLAAAAKKAGRIAAEGLVYAYVDGKVGVVVEVNSETDFVAKNADFGAFVKDLAEIIAKENPADVDALQNCKFGDLTVADELREKILTIGENIKIRRFERYEGNLVTYVHAGGRIGVMIDFDTTDDIASKEEFQVAGKDVAMQIAALNPNYLSREFIPADELEKEKRIQMEQVIASGKPEAIAEKIVMGKMGKYYKENCLVDQPFVKDDKISVSDYLNNTAKALGGEIKIKRYVRFEKGEGLEKRNDNFADEVASMMK
jgi:elongation factor Ts